MHITGKHLTKNALYDILSLADQLYYSKSIISDSFKQKKIYFSKNTAFNLLKESEVIFYEEVNCYNLSLSKNKLLTIMSNEYTLKEEILISKLQENNEWVNKLFNQAQKTAAIISDFFKLYLLTRA